MRRFVPFFAAAPASHRPLAARSLLSSLSTTTSVRHCSCTAPLALSGAAAACGSASTSASTSTTVVLVAAAVAAAAAAETSRGSGAGASGAGATVRCDFSVEEHEQALFQTDDVDAAVSAYHDRLQKSQSLRGLFEETASVTVRLRCSRRQTRRRRGGYLAGCS